MKISHVIESVDSKVAPVSAPLRTQSTRTQPKQNVHVAPEKKTPAAVIHIGKKDINEFSPIKPPTAGAFGGNKDYGQPTSSRYLGNNKFVLGTTNNYVLTATVDKWGLEWDEDDEIWFLDSPGSVYIADATEGEIELPSPQEQRNQIHDLVSDYLNARNSAELQRVAAYYGHSADGEMATSEGWGGAITGAVSGGLIGSIIGYPMSGTLLGTWLGSLLTAEKSAEKSSSNNNKRYWVYINGQSPSHNNNDYEPLSLEEAIAQIAAAAEKEHDRKTQYTIVNANTGQVVFRKYWSDQDDFERGLEPGWQDVEHTETIPPASTAPQRIDPTLDSPPASPKKTVPADFSKPKFSSYKKPGDMEEGIRVPAQQILGTKNRAKSAYYPTNVKPKVPKLDKPLTDQELARLAQLAGIKSK